MTKSPTKLLHRVACGSAPWVPYKQTRFQERFDDSEKRYFVLYGCSERVGCFVECLAYFRENDELRWDELDATGEFADERPFPIATVPPGWYAERSTQSAWLPEDSVFADVAHSGWIAKLRDTIPRYLCRGVGYPYIDQSTIYQARSRPITQWISRKVFDDREQRYAGIYYRSRHGADFENWAIFADRVSLSIVGEAEAIKESDPDLLAACALLRLRPPSVMIARSSGD